MSFRQAHVSDADCGKLLSHRKNRQACVNEFVDFACLTIPIYLLASKD